MSVHTSITERVGIDCSCFSVDGNHFSTRTYAEKSRWLRAISNVKVKLRHGAANPTAAELVHYRLSILDCAKGVARCPPGKSAPKPLLPRREVPNGPDLDTPDGYHSIGNGFLPRSVQAAAAQDSSDEDGLGDPALPPPEPSYQSANATTERS